MPKLGVTESFSLKTRDSYTKVECEVSIKLDGMELPSNEVVGGALDKAVLLIQEHVTESYNKVPERV